ncbi:feruloyl-CoA synthase [Pendulispora rubella]|uniref:Feruloyl-CoA synthase n=1 Tax=Pendulispora rubella TaxID=2741070 RepID=A0ABZ2LIW2_9BACT
MARPPRFADPAISIEQRPDGSMLLCAQGALGDYPAHLGAVLRAWAERAPDRVFLAERTKKGGTREVTYGEAYRTARRLGARMLDDGLGPARPVMIVSDNSVDHALVALGAMVAGVPVVPISAAYSLMSRDHAKLRTLHAMVHPGWVFADGDAYARAIAALPLDPTTRVAVGLSALLEVANSNSADVDGALNAIGPDQVAKILFTSGSTGAPKGVINTHRMLCSNQQALAQGWPFLGDRPPVVVDWLPWSHTFGGNHNFNLVLWHGGTLWVDRGKPVPGRIEDTVDVLRHVSPTLYFNVPRGFDALLPYLENDAALAETFFRDLDLLFYAAAALPRPIWDRLVRLGERTRGEAVPFVSAWGATETSPLVTQVHFPIDDPSIIGVPTPGTTLKLVPNGTKLEARVKGPQVTPGYLHDADGFRAMLDDEGFYPTGDAVRLADPANPNRGIVFDGRVSENFKLSSGTWVHTGALRLGLIAALSPLVQDAVIAGHDRDFVAALLFPSAAASKDEGLRTKIETALRAHNARANGATSQIVRYALILDEPPSIDAGEITDKGYINQRAVLDRRAAWVECLFAADTGPDVIRT